MERHERKIVESGFELNCYYLRQNKHLLPSPFPRFFSILLLLSQSAKCRGNCLDILSTFLSGCVCSQHLLGRWEIKIVPLTELGSPWLDCSKSNSQLVRFLFKGVVCQSFLASSSTNTFIETCFVSSEFSQPLNLIL